MELLCLLMEIFLAGIVFVVNRAAKLSEHRARGRCTALDVGNPNLKAEVNIGQQRKYTGQASNY